MSKVFDALTITGYIALTVFVAWSALNPACVYESACLMVFGVLCDLQAFLVGQRSPRSPRRVSSSPVYPD